MKIYAPVKDANGVYASVRFVNGVGETDNPRLIEWFKDHGYSLEKCDNSSQKSYEKCDEDANLIIEPQNDQIEEEDDEVETVEMMGYPEKVEYPDFEPMTPNEIREWAIANGFGNKIRNIRSKEKLLQIIRG